MSVTKENKTAFQTPQSPRMIAVTIADSEADAKALVTDSLFVPKAQDVLLHLGYLNAYDNVIIAIPEQARAEEMAKLLRAANPTIYIHIPTKQAWECCSSIGELIQTKSMIIPDVAPYLMENSTPFKIGGTYICNSADVIDYTVEPCILTGIPELDRLSGGIRASEVTLITGFAGHGKSTFADQVALSAMNQETKVCIYSGELGRKEHNTNLILQAAGRDHIEMRIHPQSRAEWPVVTDPALKDRIDEAFMKYAVFVDHENLPYGSDAMFNIFRYHAETGSKLFLVDNMMALTSSIGSKVENIYDRQRVIIEKLTHFAKRYDVSVLLVVHPKKTDGEIQTFNDISGTVDIAGWAHNILALHKVDVKEREERKSKNEPAIDARLKTLKSRSRPTDKQVELVFDPKGMRFSGVDLAGSPKYPHFKWEDIPPMEQASIFEEPDHAQPA